MTDEDADLGVGLCRSHCGGCASLGQACSGVPVLLPQVYEIKHLAMQSANNRELSEFERDTIIRRNKSVCEISLLLDIQL